MEPNRKLASQPGPVCPVTRPPTGSINGREAPLSQTHPDQTKTTRAHLKHPEGLEEAGVWEEGARTHRHAVPAPEAQTRQGQSCEEGQVCGVAAGTCL